MTHPLHATWLVLLCILVTTAQDYEDIEDEYDDSTNLNSTMTNGTLMFTKKLLNLTKDSGSTVKLVCEVQNLDVNNTKVTFRWKHNEVILSGEESRYKIRNRAKNSFFNSTLRISKLEFFDRGMIECIASNGVSRIISRGILDVTPETHKYGSTDINALDLDNTDSNINTEITTFLPNQITKLGTNKLYTTLNSNSKSYSTPLQFDLDTHSEVIETESVYNSSEPFCQLYRGHSCKNYLSGQYVFVQPPYSQKDIEDKLDAAFLVISQSNDLSATCNRFAQPSICFSAFPLCKDHKKVNLYQVNHRHEFMVSANEAKHKFKNIRSSLTDSLRRICRDECLLLENELCSREYSIAKRHVVLGKILELEVCELLPLEREPSAKHCLTLRVGDLNLNREEKCFWDSGKLYRGDKDVSMTGKKCLRWSHQFRIPVSDYPELAGHNYCRNPGEMEAEPFCFVEQNKIELCGISRCVLVFGIYVSAIIVGICMIISSVVIYLYARKRKKISKNLQNMNLPQVNKNIYGNPGPSSPMEMSTLLPTSNTHQKSHSNKNGLQMVPQYTYKEVRFLDELGEGAFGKVYKGELKTKTGKIFVAVKSLKENASAKTQADFQREIELISELKHPNVICLLGVVMKQEPMCMLFEFMSEGDLHEFLIANSPEEGKCLTHDQFLDIAIQIAQGMEYLSGNHYVHRDLAARNCLVSKDLVVKISDFGLSRDMYSCDYYRVQSKSLLPVRWMPPESILYGKFTTESDVWSYGVVLWEIYSYGLQPYYGFNNQEVINMIRSRKLLPCPDACPSYSYALMVECWAEQSNRRPDFSEIVHRLKVWKQSGPMSGAYFKTSATPQKHSHGSKSSHTSGSQDNKNVCSWDRNAHGYRLNDSQSSLTSKSSVGNTTQSTNVSSEIRKDRKGKRNIDSLDRAKNTMITTNENGERVETKITL